MSNGDTKSTVPPATPVVQPPQAPTHHPYYAYGAHAPSPGPSPYSYGTPEAARLSASAPASAGAGSPATSAAGTRAQQQPPANTGTPSSTSTPPRHPTGYGSEIPHPWPHHLYGSSPYHPPPDPRTPQHHSHHHHHHPPVPHYPPPWAYPPRHPHGSPAATHAPPTHPYAHYYPHMHPPPHPPVPGVGSSPSPGRGAAATTAGAAAAAATAQQVAHQHHLYPPANHTPIQPSNRRGGKSGKQREDLREGATSPSQILSTHRDEVQNLGCTCKRTRCLKLYCQCFGAKLYCGTQCRCLLCCNIPRCEKMRKEAQLLVLTRNPNAFDTKYKKLPGPVGAEATTTTGTAKNSVPASTSAAGATGLEAAAQKKSGTVFNGSIMSTTSLPEPPKILAHRTGCRCKKSNCMKKYCECYAGFVKCTRNCRCVDCKNMVSNIGDSDDPGDDQPVSTKLPRKRPVQQAQAVHGHQNLAPPPLQPLAPALHPHPAYHHHLPPPHPYAHVHHPHLMHHHVPPPYHILPPEMHGHTPPQAAALMNAAESRGVGMPAPGNSAKGVERRAPDTSNAVESESSGEPWLAAQNLTFLKRGSPPSEKKPKLDSEGAANSGPHNHHHHEEIASMPSLAESSQGTEPTAQSQEEASSSEPGVNSLLMAAMAMTEFANN